MTMTTQKETTMKPVKAFRTFAAFVFLMAVFGFAITALVNFGIALFAQSGDALVSGFVWLVITFITMIFTSLIAPKKKKGEAGDVAEPKPAKQQIPAVHAVVIPADPVKRLRHATIGSDLPNLKRLVGGELVAVGGGADWVAYAGSAARQQTPNRRATHVMGFMSGRSIEVPVIGDVVIVGRQVSGEPGDIPGVTADKIQALAEEVTA